MDDVINLARFHRKWEEQKTESVWVVGPLGAVSLNIHHFGDLGLPSGRTANGSVDRHSPTQIYESDYFREMGCEWLEGVPCYCDGSCLMADDLIEWWLDGQTERVYEALGLLYVDWLVRRGDG